MALGNNTPVSTQRLRDYNFIVTTAMPAAGATANSNNIDLGPQVFLPNGVLDVTQTTPFPVTRYVIVNVSTTASACTANSKNCNIVLQHTPANTDGTANSANWTNIPELANPLLRVTDSSGNMAAGSANVLLPPACKRFIRAQAVTEANGGTPNTDANFILQLGF